MKTNRILRRVRLWAIWVVSIVVGIPLLLYLGTKAMVAHEISAARASKIPLEPSQLPRKQIAPKDNGAVAYQKAFDLLEDVDRTHKRLSVSATAVNNQMLPVELDQEMALINRYRAALDAAEIAASKPACDFAPDWSKGIRLRFPELSFMKVMVRLESAEAGILVAKGEAQDALRHLRFAEKICQDMSATQNFAAETSYAAAEDVVFHSMISMLSSDRLTPALLDGVQTILDSLPSPPPIRFYAEGELVLNRIIIHRIPDMDPDELDELMAGAQTPEERRNLERVLQMRSLNPLFEENYINYYRTFIDALPKDDSDWPALKTVAEQADRRSSIISLPSSCTLLFSKSMKGACSEWVKHLARTRMLGCAVRLLKMKKSGKSLPDSLPDFAGISIDPFSGKPFLYDLSGDRFEIFSVGPNNNGSTHKGVNDLMVAIPAESSPAPGKYLRAPGVQVRLTNAEVMSKLRLAALARRGKHG